MAAQLSQSLSHIAWGGVAENKAVSREKGVRLCLCEAHRCTQHTTQTHTTHNTQHTTHTTHNTQHTTQTHTTQTHTTHNTQHTQHTTQTHTTHNTQHTHSANCTRRAYVCSGSLRNVSSCARTSGRLSSAAAAVEVKAGWGGRVWCQ